MVPSRRRTWDRGGNWCRQEKWDGLAGSRCGRDTRRRVFVVPSDLEGQSLALLDAMGGDLGVGASEVAENKEEIVEQQIWRIACCF